MYPVVICCTVLLKMAIEIASFPTQSVGCFQSSVNVYQRVIIIWSRNEGDIYPFYRFNGENILVFSHLPCGKRLSTVTVRKNNHKLPDKSPFSYDFPMIFPVSYGFCYGFPMPKASPTSPARACSGPLCRCGCGLNLLFRATRETPPAPWKTTLVNRQIIYKSA